MGKRQDLIKCVSSGEADRRFGSGPRLTFEAEPGAIRLRGVVDASNSNILREWLSLQPPGEDLVLDIGDLRFPDDAGLRVLEEMVKASGRSRKLILTGSGKSTRVRRARRFSPVAALQHP